MNTPRYAIYFVPGADTELYRFGASVLGHDCHTGCDCALIDGVDASWPAYVREPRVYGFHATVKAPFRLAKDFSEVDLNQAVRDFAADQPAILVGGLVVSELGSFIALVPQTPCPPLDRFAGACVREFDRFRAPLGEPERQRRLAADLSARQIKNLEQWGYPYVFEDFRFHMTLTGSLPTAKRRWALQLLCGKFEQLQAAQPLVINRLAVARQNDSKAPFQVIQQALLGHSRDRSYAYSC